MSAPHRRPAALLPTLVTLFAVGLSGCSAEHPGAGPGTPPATGTGGTVEAKPAAPKPPGAPGDILVAGRPVTGSEPTGFTKVPFKRTYADGELYASVTGFRSTAFGSAGLDAAMQGEIAAGKDVGTTIDPGMQRAAFDALRGRKGAAIALDAQTGAITTLVSAPSFDPGTFNGNLPSDAKAWERVTKDPDQPLVNRALRNTENPGSALHVVVAAAALEKGLLASVDTPTHSPAVHVVPDSTTQFSGDPAHCTDASLRTALQYACSNVFARLAADLGAEALAATAEKFGFNQEKTDTPVRAFESTWPRRPENPAQLALMANGLFDTKATPVQMAMVMATIANGGNRVHPQLVTAPSTPVPAQRVLAQHTADELRSALGGSVRAWVPSASVTWSLSFGRTPAGRPLAVAVCLSTPADTTEEAARIAERIAGGGTRQ